MFLFVVILFDEAKQVVFSYFIGLVSDLCKEIIKLLQVYKLGIRFQVELMHLFLYKPNRDCKKIYEEVIVFVRSYEVIKLLEPINVLNRGRKILDQSNMTGGM